MHKGEIDRLVGARQNVPLVVGLDDGESFLASDVAAILAHTNRIVFLEEGDVADVRPTGVVVTDIDGAARERAGDDHRLDARGRREGRLRPLHAQGDPRAAGGAPPVDRRPRDPRRPDPGRGARRARRRDPAAVDPRRARRLRQRLLRVARRRAPRSRTGPASRPGRRSARSSATRRRRSTATTLVIAVTQSGETADTIAPTRLARERGCPIVAVTNTVGSAITREADAVAVPPGRPRDRRRGVEDVRHPGHDARDPGRGDRQDPRHAARRAASGSSVPRCTRCPAPPPGRSTTPPAASERSPAAT